jgi:hypothetical protein
MGFSGAGAASATAHGVPQAERHNDHDPDRNEPSRSQIK